MAEVLVIGTGGREQAIAQAMESSSEVSRVIVEPSAQTGLKAFSGNEQKPLVVVGPEAELVAGLADELRDQGYLVFGASKNAAQYEASKSKAIRMAKAARIFHPHTSIAEGKIMSLIAIHYVNTHYAEDYVIKADGLASGKGVVLPKTDFEAKKTIRGMIDGSLFDGAGQEIINFQTRHKGAEVSAMIVVGAGKEDFVVLPLSQDHKRLNDRDQGPNTGGMGAYAPVPESIVDEDQYQQIQEMAYASLAGMEAEGITYERAVLYMGLMMVKDPRNRQKIKPMLLEYNVRFGDPETQAVLPLLTRAGVDVYRLLRSAAEGSLEKPEVDLSRIGQAALSVCLAAPGYPGSTRKGSRIDGLDRNYEDTSIQLAAARKQNGKLFTNGGRVLYVTGFGETVQAAAEKAYLAIGENAINFAGMQYRKDIGLQARKSV